MGLDPKEFLRQQAESQDLRWQSTLAGRQSVEAVLNTKRLEARSLAIYVVSQLVQRGKPMDLALGSYEQRTFRDPRFVPGTPAGWVMSGGYFESSDTNSRSYSVSHALCGQGLLSDGRIAIHSGNGLGAFIGRNGFGDALVDLAQASIPVYRDCPLVQLTVAEQREIFPSNSASIDECMQYQRLVALQDIVTDFALMQGIN